MPSVTNFLDTNILVYAVTDEEKSGVAQRLISEPFILSAQALNEFAHVGRRKLGLSWERITQIVEDMAETAYAVVAVDADVTRAALLLVQDYNLAFYDAAMLAAALNANCTTFLSEDLQNGFVVDGRLTVINPFL